jgi:hypothetical protein
VRLRSLLATAAGLALTLGMTGPAHGHDAGPPGISEVAQPTSAADEDPYRVVTYEIQTRGAVTTSPTAFAADAAAILGDARGWTLGGSVAFREVASSGQFNLVIASPAAVGAAHEVCSPDYSCRVGDDVLINDRNWREATAAWRATGAPRWQYRQYLINHEVGHYLGFGHHDCSGAGEPAPVMQQQSISLDGCEPNGWPLAWERESLGAELDVPVHDDWVFPDVLRGNTHREAIHTLADAGIARGGDDGFYRPRAEVQRAQMAAFLARALELSAEQAPRFPDVPGDHIHADSIAAADEHGIVEGYTDGSFGAWDPVSRAQMATFLARAYELTTDVDPPYEDVDVDDTHGRNIAAVTEAGIAIGYDDERFRPNEAVTRAQMASFLARAEGLA